MAISAKEMPKNHTDKERFAAALSCIQTGILTLLFQLKRRRSSPSPFISHRVLEAVASWILKSLFSSTHAESKNQRNIELMTFALTWCANIFVGCSVTPTFFLILSILRKKKKKKKNLCVGSFNYF